MVKLDTHMSTFVLTFLGFTFTNLKKIQRDSRCCSIKPGMEQIQSSDCILPFFTLRKDIFIARYHPQHSNSEISIIMTVKIKMKELNLQICWSLCLLTYVVIYLEFLVTYDFFKKASK